MTMSSAPMYSKKKDGHDINVYIVEYDDKNA